MSVKHLVSLAEWTREECDEVLRRSKKLKRKLREKGPSRRLQGKTLALVFHKPSLRTRVSFETAMAQMGGSSLFITDREIGMDSRETIEDIARVMSGYVDGIVIRTFANTFVERMAAASSVPVINALTDSFHPCQILADLLTAREHGKDLDAMAVAYVGDGNNVAHSWINAAIHYHIDLRIVHPEGYAPDNGIVARARSRGAQVTLVTDPSTGVEGADIVYTDVWASMGQESEKDERLRRFRGFQVDGKLMSRAKEEALFMHCLPAHRGEEVAAEVIDGPRSVIFDEAHNRLHAQKGLLDYLLAR